MRTIAELMARLRFDFGNRDDEDFDTRILEYINQALEDVLSKNIEEFPVFQGIGTLTTVSGTNAYSVTADVKDASDAAVTDFGYPQAAYFDAADDDTGQINLQMVSKEKLDSFDETLAPVTSEGEPLAMAQFQRKLHFFPSITAVRTLTIPYFAEPADYAAGSPADRLTVCAMNVLLYGAKWHGWQSIGNLKLSKEAGATYGAYLEQFRNSVLAREVKHYRPRRSGTLESWS